MAKIPSTFKKYFWDTNFAKIDFNKHKIYVIERLLEHGDMNAYRWLKKNFTKSLILKVSRISRRLSKYTKNYWQIISSPKS